MRMAFFIRISKRCGIKRTDHISPQQCDPDEKGSHKTIEEFKMLVGETNIPRYMYKDVPHFQVVL